MSDIDWEALNRMEPVTLCGFVVEPMSRQRIISMYPELKASKWWVDCSQDLYLSVFFGQPDELGVHVGPKYYGVSAWRPGLRRRFKIDCVYESLSRFSDPMDGQQKNFLVALTSMAQTRTADHELYEGYATDSQQRVQPEQSVQPEEVRREAEVVKSYIHQEYTQRMGYSTMINLAKKNKTAQLIYRWHRKGAEVPEIQHEGCKDSCACSPVVRCPVQQGYLRYKTQGTLDQTMRGFVNHIERHYETSGFYLRKKNVLWEDPYQEKAQDRTFKREKKRKKTAKIRPNIDVIGSRMGLDSGLWHESFVEFVASFHHDMNVRFYDQYEEAKSYFLQSVRVDHFTQLYTGPSNTAVQIDDAQIGEEHVEPDWMQSYYYSSKKMGEYSFGIRETRDFSHIIPAKLSESMSSCACWRCKVTTYVAQMYGGWPVYQRIREWLAKLGPVCEHSNMQGLTMQIVQAERNYYDTGQPIPAGLRSFVSVEASQGRLQEFIRERSGIVYHYLSDFAKMIFKRRKPVDFIVTDTWHPVEEEGMPPYIVTQSTRTFPGYELQEYVENYSILRLKREQIAVCLELKW